MGLRNLLRHLFRRPETEPEYIGPPDVAALMDLLRRAIAGEDIPDQEVYDVEWRASELLDKFAREARGDLGRWINDDDIREKYPDYAHNTRERLIWLLDELEKGTSEYKS